jgi:hypothetical protein
MNQSTCICYYILCFITILYLFAIVAFKYYVFTRILNVDLVPLPGFVVWPIIDLICIVNIESSHFEFQISCPYPFRRPSEGYGLCSTDTVYLAWKLSRLWRRSCRWMLHLAAQVAPGCHTVAVKRQLQAGCCVCLLDCRLFSVSLVSCLSLCSILFRLLPS